MKLLGTTDETTTCECCGKPNLKKTVVLETEDGGEVRYGVDCAAKALLGKKSRSNRNTIIARAQAVSMLQRLLAKGVEPNAACSLVVGRTGYEFYVDAGREINVNGGWFTLPV